MIASIPKIKASIVKMLAGLDSKVSTPLAKPIVRLITVYVLNTELTSDATKQRPSPCSKTLKIQIDMLSTRHIGVDTPDRHLWFQECDDAS